MVAEQSADSVSAHITHGPSERSGTPVVELNEIRRVYRMGTNVVTALDSLTFTFHAGEYWSIMGSSGSGKSTLLNVLSCIDRPSSGSYKIRGQEVSQLSDDELSDIRGHHIGFVFQSYNLIQQLNVLENILVPLFYQDDAPADGEERAFALAKRMGLGDRIDHKPNELSGGQQQRVAIARALINDPAILLADEATGNLDSRTAHEILDLFDELHAEGKTILLVTHEPMVGGRAERTLRLRDGKVEDVRENRATGARIAAKPAKSANTAGSTSPSSSSNASNPPKGGPA